MAGLGVVALTLAAVREWRAITTRARTAQALCSWPSCYEPATPTDTCASHDRTLDMPSAAAPAVPDRHDGCGGPAMSTAYHPLSDAAKAQALADYEAARDADAAEWTAAKQAGGIVSDYDSREGGRWGEPVFRWNAKCLRPYCKWSLMRGFDDAPDGTATRDEAVALLVEHHVSEHGWDRSPAIWAEASA